MGKGDKKTKKGKRFMGSYGILRKRKPAKVAYQPKKKTSAKKIEVEEDVPVEEVKGTAEKTPAKKAKAKSKAKPKAKAAKKKASAQKKETKKK